MKIEVQTEKIGEMNVAINWIISLVSIFKPSKYLIGTSFLDLNSPSKGAEFMKPSQIKENSMSMINFRFLHPQKLSWVLTAILFGMTMSFAQADDLQGKIVTVDKSESKTFKVAAKIKLGEKIQTHQERLRVQFGNDVIVQINPDTEVTFNQKKDEALVANLAKGGILSQVRTLATPSKKPRYQVRTRSALMGVRGTTLFAYSEKENTFLCDCEGEVELNWNDATQYLKTKHHDSPLWMDATSKKQGNDSIVPHTDEEISELKKLIGQK